MERRDPLPDEQAGTIFLNPLGKTCEEDRPNAFPEGPLAVASAEVNLYATSNMTASPLPAGTDPNLSLAKDGRADAYFSADVETDGPIPGPFSMLSIGLVYAGRFDGRTFDRPVKFDRTFYRELKPISDEFQPDALGANGLDRDRLIREGCDPAAAMTDAAAWVREVAAGDRPILVAYPLGFDWTWIYWYFVRFVAEESPFSYSRCFDVKTAFAVKARLPVARAGRSSLNSSLRSPRPHTHNALDDAIEQAEIFANVFEWEGNGRVP